jgi:phosphoribosyl 1,2-cyclic phosphate phosphodiesterase
MRVTILGCGASGGVPRIGNDWGECDPGEPRNRRTRASILVETDLTRVLVDTSPDLRQQCLDRGIADFDAVLYTHSHADHCHGIDELRVLAARNGRPMPIYAAADTLATLQDRFHYAFGDPNSPYPAILEPHQINGPQTLGDLDVTPFGQDHGGVTTLGLRFGRIAYSTDLVTLDDAAFAALEGVDTWIVGALRPEPHPTHAHVDRVLEWIARVRPKRAVLTHMSALLDYAALTATLPNGIKPAHDGLVLEV